jgi:hormone-sensitive lipase
LTIQAIKAGVRVPDGILLAYPALSLDIRAFTPSFLVSLDDSCMIITYLVLHHTVLKLCLDSYVKPEFDSTMDPLLSPSKASSEILNRFPKTRIVVGTYDPLHDESFRLLHKLVQLGKDVKLIEY